MKRTIEYKELADRSPDYQEETIELAGCTGQCPRYPGAPLTKDGFADCSKCPENISNEKENKKE